MTGVLIRERGDSRQGRRPSGDGGRDWKDSAKARARQEPPEARGGKEGSSGEASGEQSPASTSIPDFWPAELGEDKFLLFQATNFMVIYCGNPRKVM